MSYPIDRRPDEGRDALWDHIFATSEWGKYPGESLIRFVASNFYGVSDRRAIRMLEVGCGPGANVWYLSREGFRVSGIDGSDVAIRRAGERMVREGLQADLRVGDVVRLPYDDGSFDAVFDVECLCCNDFEHSSRILRELNRVMKPDAMIYSRTFADDMYAGSSSKQAGPLEYVDVNDGPLRGKGFVRLTDRPGIDRLYGQHFQLRSVDKEERTEQNGAFRISEWMIVGRKSE